jgi:hypothetical protein
MKKLFAALLFVSSSAHAITGNELLASLENKEPGVRVYGLGYLSAVADMTRGTIQCPNPNVTYGQAQDVVIKFVKENPEIRHFPASQIVTFILKQTWPCKGEI